MSKQHKNPVIAYFANSLEEFGKVTWPTKEQAALLTAITLGFSLVVIAFIALVDLGFSELYQLIAS